MAALAVAPAKKDLPLVGYVLLMDFARAAGSRKSGLELQDEYYEAAGETYSWLNNSAQMYFDVFTAFREFSRTIPDGSMIENALDALQQAHDAYFGSGCFGDESCRDAASIFLDDPAAYLPDRKARHALISERTKKQADPGKPFRDGLRDVIAQTLVVESKSWAC